MLGHYFKKPKQLLFIGTLSQVFQLDVYFDFSLCFDN